MNNNGRQYAEGLVGALDTSGYDSQRNYAQQSYNTNWEALQNQYKNLTEKLKQQQKQANTDFAQGLADVSSDSFDRLKNTDNKLVNRGLTTSGVNDQVKQEDTTQKGEDVLKLLKKAGSTASSSAEQLASGNTSLANKENTLNAKVADTLGDIGANETAAQMKYNAKLADIAADKDTRELNNALAAKQRAASAAASGYNTKKEDSELEDFYKKMTINSVLTNYDASTGETLNLDDQDKKNYLAIMFGKQNAGEIVDAYNKNVNATDTYNNSKTEYENDLKKATSSNASGDVTKDIRSNATSEEKLLNELLKNGENNSFAKSGGADKLIEYLQQQNGQNSDGQQTISKDDAINALKEITGSNGDLKLNGFNTQNSYNSQGPYTNPQNSLSDNSGNISLDDLIKTYNSYKSGETPLLSQQISSGITSNKNNAQTNLDNLIKTGITYEDLAKLLYGNN